MPWIQMGGAGESPFEEIPPCRHCYSRQLGSFCWPRPKECLTLSASSETPSFESDHWDLQPPPTPLPWVKGPRCVKSFFLWRSNFDHPSWEVFALSHCFFSQSLLVINLGQVPHKLNQQEKTWWHVWLKAVVQELLLNYLSRMHSKIALKMFTP